eukprot:TRINITY_DN61915_c0_g1_i1.p1 TRINITY_DN61915_c0_g1~~TRINITY_DN61915_c0_g1_i1.p1  ORF type:complete len:403 (-),score=85.67 TRINITY_DN61915_c0_g1_i1:7-1215(-)
MRPVEPGSSQRRQCARAVLAAVGLLGSVGVVHLAFVSSTTWRPCAVRRLHTSRYAAAPEPRDGVDWDNLGFGLTTKDTQMVIATCQRGGEWDSFEVKPYGAMQLEPSATILNYGQGIFEGMKAYRTSKGRIVLFRPEMNAKRMEQGARRFLMPPVPQKLFLEMCAAAARANADWVPPAGKGELYMRPLLMGSGASLGVGPSPEFSFVIYAAPVGRYFSGSGARLLVETGHSRASELGVGHVKAAGNYAPCFAPQAAAKESGFSDVLYLDASGKYIEEAAASNFFCVRDGVLHTPSLGTILPGVTRDSTIQLARRLAESGDADIQSVEEASISVEDVLGASEAFVTGTGAGVTPVAHVEGAAGTVDMPTPGPVTKKLQESLRNLQLELEHDGDDWLWDVFHQT